jgi:UDP-glucose 4-epimerase
MNTLVLGGCGFIGSHLVDRLRAEGHDVRVMDRQHELYRAPLPDVDYHIGDLGHRAQVHTTLEGREVVFHLASTTVPRTSNEDPAFDVMSNVVETLHLLDECVRAGVRKIVFASSGGAVYGTPERLPVREDDPTNPQSSYGIAKLTIEKYLELYHRLHGLDHVIVRPSNPYGPRQNHLGDQGMVAVSMGKLAAGQPIQVRGGGDAVKDYVYIDDLIDGIYRAANRVTASRVFNLGSGVGLSVNELVRLIGDTVGRQPSEVRTVGDTLDVSRIYLDISRAGRELDWRPQTPMAVGLRHTWDFISAAAT